MAVFAEEFGVRGARKRVSMPWETAAARAAGGGACLSELLFGPLRALYLDIEWKGARHDARAQAVLATADRALQQFRGAKSTSRHVFTACGRGKASYHAHLFVDKPFASPVEAGEFVRAHVLPHHVQIVDPAPYGRVQCWRMVNCVKRSAPDRPLVPLDGAPVTADMVLSQRIRASITGAVPPPLPPSAGAAEAPPALLTFAQRVLGEGAAAWGPVPASNSVVVTRLVHQRGAQWIIPSLSRQCPIAMRRHRSNHVYLVVDAELLTYQIRCHAAGCALTLPPPRLVPQPLREALMARWPSGTGARKKRKREEEQLTPTWLAGVCHWCPVSV